MDTPDDTQPDGRTRVPNPTWRLEAGNGSFLMDLSWDDDSRRWLEVLPGPDVEHCWVLVLCEASDDSSDATYEVVEHGGPDVTLLLNGVAAEPWEWDRAPKRASQ